MRCQSCSAPLNAGQATCVYCGFANDLDLQQENYFTTHRPEKARHCCDCQGEMECLNLRKSGAPFYVERCAQCKSLFFDTGELEQYLDQKLPSIITPDRKGLAELQQRNTLGEFHYRKCPVCQNMMLRINFGKTSGVVVDRCIDHGTYLDAGELQRILAWMRKGGHLIKSQEDSAKPRPKNDSFRTADGMLIESTPAPENSPLLNALDALLRRFTGH